MSDVDRLLEEYVAEYRAGGEADPLSYLQRAPDAGRAELAALIDGFLSRAPRQPADAAAPSPAAERVVEALQQSLQGAAGLWPAVLPRWRKQAQLKRADLVSRLAAGLGVSGREEKVGRYYHEMEQGLLPSESVSSRVIEALGEIVGQSADAVRRAGQALEPGQGPAGKGAVFARTTVLESRDMPPPPAPAAAAPTGGTAREEPEWDEIDELFRGGA